MIDGDEAETGGDVPFARNYDFFKHLTGIALVSIGGVLAFADKPGMAEGRTPTKIMIVLGALGISAVTSLLMAGMLTGLEVKPVTRERVRRRIAAGGAVAVCFLAVGLGAFVQTYLGVMLT